MHTLALPRPSPSLPHRLAALVLSLFAVFAVAALGGLATASGTASWYATIAKPSFNPPSWVFGPVWTLLYILMAVAAYLLWSAPIRPEAAPIRRWALIAYAVQLLLNLAWSPAFFALQSPFAGVLVIVPLWISILVTLLLAWRVRRSAAMLLLPYLAWVSFAALLNMAIWRLNASA
jgi:tryptophan-rich sensory protein